MKNSQTTIIIFLLSIVFWGCKAKESKREKAKTLKGTEWTSRFFNYCNYYCFTTDSTGFSEDGRVANSFPIPIDTSVPEYGETEIVYNEPEKFKYNISDTVLTIVYINWKPHDKVYQRIFHYDSIENAWISEHEYVYGREWMYKGQKKLY